MAHEKEVHDSVIVALENEVVAPRIVVANAIVVNLTKMVPVALATMVVNAHQNVQVWTGNGTTKGANN